MIRTILHKMKTTAHPGKAVQYELTVPDGTLVLNSYLGQKIAFQATGSIFCRACGRKTSKSYQQGYCFPCTQKLPETDLCSVRPERCHFRKGTCRDAEWGVAHCMIPHTIYLANSSGIKVGITRSHHRQTRWIDQGAVQAIPLAQVSQRLDAGVMEVMLKEFYPDKTNWRSMLQGSPELIDLEEARDEALASLPATLSFTPESDAPISIAYPVLQYPSKVKSLNLDKDGRIEGTLQGIKGQYWILDKGVINIRSFAGYEIALEL